MEIGDRIKEVRRELHKTQQAFADAIGLKRNTIANYEINNIVPSDRTIADICREFHVNEFWLRTGEGEMFSPRTRDTELADFFGDLLADEPDFRHRLISVLSRLSTDEWELLEQMAQKLVEEEQKEKAGP